MITDQLVQAIQNLEAIYRDAGDKGKAAGLQAFANLLAESPGVPVTQWCKIVSSGPKKKSAKRAKAKA
jgi:hypothetical protein